MFWNKHEEQNCKSNHQSIIKKNDFKSYSTHIIKKTTFAIADKFEKPKIPMEDDQIAIATNDPNTLHNETTLAFGKIKSNI